MKKALFAVLVVAMSVGAVVAQESKVRADKWKAHEIIARVDQGETSALDEVAVLDPSVSVPSLQIFALGDVSEPPERTKKAREALRKVKGAAQYLKNVIQTGIDVKVVDHKLTDAFKTMSLLGNKEAIAAIAPLLFNETLLTSGMEDVGGTKVDWEAAHALGLMELPDAPTSTRPDLYHKEDVQKWREWWLKNKSRYAN